MKRMWSPWRMKYIEQPANQQECFLCEAAVQPDDPKNLVVYSGEQVFVIVNRYPYSSGHIMVAPKIHISTLSELEKEVQKELMALLVQAQMVLGEVYSPEGYNIGANLGSAAGAGIPGHLHFHIVPRWVGDTNFMSSLGDTRVLPEGVDDTLTRLKAAWH